MSPQIESIIRKKLSLSRELRGSWQKWPMRNCREAAWEGVRKDEFPHPAWEWTTDPIQWLDHWAPAGPHSSIRGPRMPSCISPAAAKITDSPSSRLVSAASLLWRRLWASVFHMWIGNHNRIHLIGLLVGYIYEKFVEVSLEHVFAITIIITSLL